MENASKQLGDFEILRELGRGGMGVVYEARQKSLNRRVALKVLATGLGLSSKAIMRFKREAEAAAKLHHTNIVPIYATGEENHVPYYAMELVEGPSLDQVICQLRQDANAASTGGLDSTCDFHHEPSNGEVPEWVAATIGFGNPEAKDAASSSTSGVTSSSSLATDSGYYDNVARMMAEVADALAHAHDQGVIHRDIKPSNLLLSADGRLNLNDFGLARVLEQPGMTVSGELMGSPMYMSPEQIAAGRLPLDHRTDIYSLGATLYEVLTRRPPFDGRQRDQVLSQIVHKEPVRPRSVDKKIPKDLETICLKAMEKDPDRRYQTADLLADDLRRFVDRHAISARRIGPFERTIRWAKKNKSLSAMACVTLAVIIGSATLMYVVDRAQKREQFQRDALTAAMSGDFTKAREKLSQAGRYNAEHSWYLMVESQLDRFRGEVGDSLEKLKDAVELDDTNVTAKYMLANMYHENGQEASYLNLLDELHDVSVDKPEAKLFKGVAIQNWDIDEAMRLIKEVNEDEPGFDLALLMLAQTRALLGMDRDNVEQIELALKELDAVSLRLDRNPKLNQVRLIANIAAYHIYRRRGELERAVSHLDRVTHDADSLAEQPQFLYGNISRMHYFDLRGEIDKVAGVMRDAVSAGNRGFIVSPYAASLYRAGRIDEARALLERMSVTGNDQFLMMARVFLLTETSEERKEAKALCVRSLKNGDHALHTLGCLLFLGEDGEATKWAARQLEELEPSKYRMLHRMLLQYLSGEILEDAVDEQVEESERDRAEANYFIGLRKLARGHRSEGFERLKACAESPVFVWSDVIWSQAFVERMDEDPEWPEWLPSEPIKGKPE